MGWLFIFAAAAFEMAGVMGLKLYSGKKRFIYLIPFVGGFVMSYLFLYKSLEYLTISVAYAVWMGAGTAGAVIINMIFFGESRSRRRLISITIIVIGVAGLKAVS